MLSEIRKHGTAVADYETDEKPSEKKTKAAVKPFQMAMIKLLNIKKISEAE